jgi:hypothetical protein
MTTLTLSRLIHDTPTLVQRAGERIQGFLAGIAKARAMAQRFKTLSGMSDAELARHGLKRSEIAQAVLASTRS